MSRGWVEEGLGREEVLINSEFLISSFVHSIISTSYLR